MKLSTLYSICSLGVLLSIFIVGIGVRYHLYSDMIPTFEELGTVPFAKESASHYRYARMIAEGKPIPSVDYQAQYPEGLKVTNDSILEEYVVGYLYRILPFHDVPVHRFVSIFVILFSSLSIFAVFHMCRAIRLTHSSSLLATFIYTVSLPSILRNIGTEFAREHFSLPFIFIHASFFARAMDNDRSQKYRFVAAILSGFCIFVALASWKLCRFYFLIFVVFIALNFVFRKDFRSLRMPCMAIGSFAFLAGVVVPHLRSDLFLTSLPMMLLYSVAFLELISHFMRPIRHFALRAFVVIVVFGLLYLFLPRTGRFGHVYYTTLYQIRFLFRHPQDPSLLPFEARLYWVPGYIHPYLYNFLAYFTIPLLAAIYGVGRSLWDLFRRKGGIGTQFLLYCFFATLVSYLFFSRLHVFFIFFLAIFIGRSIDLAWTHFRKKSIKYAVVGLIIVYAIVGLMSIHQIVQVLDNWDPLRVLNILKIQPVQEEMFLENVVNMNDMITWTRENTPPQSVMLSYWHISARLLAYAERTTVLHTFWEDASMRRKVTDFAFAIYDDEEKFYEYCRQYSVNYFVYSAKFFLDFSIVGTRFLADRLAIHPESFVYKAHFYPEKLRYFGLRYQNDTFRIFEVLEKDEEKIDWAVDYQPIFDPKYAVENVEQAKQFGGEISFASYLYYSAVENVKRHRNQAALQLLQNSLSICPSLANAWNLMGEIFEKEGLNAEAMSAYRQVLSFNSNGPSRNLVEAALRRLFSSIAGSYTFEGSATAGIDSTYVGATLHLKTDSTFILANPGFEDQAGKRFSITEAGTYSITDSLITFNVIRQEPSGFDYYYLFGEGQNVLLHQIEREHLIIRGTSSSGEIITINWKR